MLRIPSLTFLLVAAVTLSACAGMNRAVGVLPNTLDDLEEKSRAFRGEDERPADARDETGEVRAADS